MSASRPATSPDAATMDPMPTAPAHAKPARLTSDQVAAWLVLAGAGLTMASFNIWHALHSQMPGYLAALVGVAPVLIAMGLSHIVATRQGWVLKAVTFLVMTGAMVLSVRATGYVVRQAFGNLWPLFGAVVDSAALVALQAILSPGAKAARGAVAEAAPGATAEAVTEAASSATGEPSGMPSAEPQTEPAESHRAEPSPKPSAEPRQRRARTDKSPEAERARAAYRKSARQGEPLSDRALGEMFGKSRTWGASRIAETEAGPRLANTGS